VTSSTVVSVGFIAFLASLLAQPTQIGHRLLLTSLTVGV
jgi:hypothetical protein